MLKYFGHNSVFFDFRTTRHVVVAREVADREVVNREVEESNWCLDNIKCFLLACLVLFYVKVVFIVPVSVHGPEFKRSECMYLIS